MWKPSILIAAAAIALTAGCSSNSETHQSEPGASAPAAAQAEHNQADVMFAQHMIPHHQQAIEMSDVILAKGGIDPRITDLATRIKAAQGPEISKMQGWLQQWGNPPMPPMSSGDGPGSHSMNGMSGMGMMSADDMTALKNAQGVEAGRLFLTGMIKHHQGAIDMAQAEIADGQFGPAIDLARSIATTQQQEIDTMKGILATL
ncbi:DUF305 domain-containing protein [Mycobacterium sp. 1274761.0]|uniref:DUF305 domain-containing protein n=1 Tax=Mycobacterium sp. 1274761.0 TaxID=1834077 RepID=UPI0007FF1C8A|nr:DUF305 domain-containing protein [Mycobacterium sp. 1274761.0]OBK71002.1 DUF305 domain-containing protein [Mycobacterium sp. 1274761.0]